MSAPISSPAGTPAAHKKTPSLYITGLVIDVIMVSLAVANLSWIIFDSAWSVTELRAIMAWVVPLNWLDQYTAVHERFFRIDLVFVSIFVSEFVLRWIEAVWHRRHAHWLVYPLLHWYDILGCIPVAGLRWLRVLRVFAILLRLQNLGIIDYTRWLPYQWGKRAYDIVMEEISDRVVIRVLSGVQEELGASHNLERNIMQNVIEPRQQVIADALRNRLINVGQSTYAASRLDLHRFITASVSKAVRANREIKIIDRIPLVGGKVGELLDHAITDIVCRVIDELTGRLSSEEFEALFSDICAAIFEALTEASENTGGSDDLTAAVSDILEVIKTQVAQRRWLGTPTTPEPEPLSARA